MSVGGQYFVVKMVGVIAFIVVKCCMESLFMSGCNKYFQTNTCHVAIDNVDIL